MKLRKLAVVAGVAMTQGACSLLFVEGPPVARPGAPLPTFSTCTHEMTLPGLDIGYGVLNVALGALIAGSGDDPSTSGSETAFGIGSMVHGGIAIGLGVHGRNKVKRCREFLNTRVEPPSAMRSPALGPDEFTGALWKQAIRLGSAGGSG